jgi:hypothetical protein
MVTLVLRYCVLELFYHVLAFPGSPASQKFVEGGSVTAVVQDQGPQVKSHPLHDCITSPSFVVEHG